MVTQETILETLKTVKFPRLSRDIVSFGIVKGVEVVDGNVSVTLSIASRDPNVPAAIESDVNRALRTLDGVRDVKIQISWQKPDTAAPGVMRDPHARPPSDEPLLPGVKFKVAVASGKGGVGKSTIAAGLAFTLNRVGLKVGLVDFDVYGPSVPTLMGTHARARAWNNKILPLERDGIKLMSMGFLVEPGTPMIWRGPMVHQATEQFLRDVEWGELDVLVVDLPPGTGDAQMTLSQKASLNGAIIVSTPQDLSLIDARKGVAMFEKMNVPVIGFVENMAGFRCEHCGEVTYIFGRGGVDREAQIMGVQLLAAIPLVPALVAAADEGNPAMAIEADPILDARFNEMSAKVLEFLGLSIGAFAGADSKAN